MSRRPKQCVILCGGKGNRLLPFTSSIPKPMIPCNGQPFLWHLMHHISEQGVEEFLLLTGYQGNQIKEFFADGSSWGWNIEYSEGPTKWNTAKRIWEAQDQLGENFLLLYCDNFVPFSLEKLLVFHAKNDLPLGSKINDLNICFKRSESGLFINELNKIKGKRLKVAKEKDASILLKDIKL